MNLQDYQPEPTCQIPGLARIYANTFGFSPFGTFVEIGAFDGRTYSNTYQLAKLGWKGVYVEPVAHLYEYCKFNHKDHPNVEVVQAFISNCDGDMQKIYKWGTDTYTGNRDFIEHVTRAQAQLFCECGTLTLTTLLKTRGIDFHFELLVVDVEGHELEVLQGFDMQVYRPKMIIIETHMLAKDDALRMHSDDIDAILCAHDYELVHTDTINSIYVAGD